MSLIQTRPRVPVALLQAALATIAFLAIVHEVSRQGMDLDLVAHATAIVSLIALPSAATLFYLDWQVRRDPHGAWLVVVCAAFALQSLRWLILLLGGDVDGAHSAWIGAFQVAVVSASALLLAFGHRLRLRQDPLLVGILAGLAVLVGRGLVLRLPSAPPPPAVAAVLVGLLMVVGLVSGIVAVRTQAFDRWTGRSLLAAAALLAISQAVLFVPSPGPAVLTGVAATQMVGAALLLTAAALRARASVIDEVAAAQVLRFRLQAAADDRHSDAARLHEIRSTIAGLTAATELLRRDGISAQRRAQLQSMVGDELARVARMVGTRRSAGARSMVRLDDAIRPVVLRNEAQGLEVRGLPSGLRVEADPDLLAELVDILLSNAREHAPSAVVRIAAERRGDRVDLIVSDTGPGIDASVRDRIFEWGARSPASPGEGVGLAAARLLADDLEAHLRLAPQRGDGTTFVLSLPTGPIEDDVPLAARSESPSRPDGLSYGRRTSTSPSRPRRPHGSPETPAGRSTGR